MKNKILYTFAIFLLIGIIYIGCIGYTEVRDGLKAQESYRKTIKVGDSSHLLSHLRYNNDNLNDNMVVIDSIFGDSVKITLVTSKYYLVK